MVPEHRVYTAPSEGQVSEPYSTIIEESRQQDTQPTRQSRQLRARHEKFEGRRRGIRLQESKATIQNRRQGAISFSSSPELQSAETSTQRVQQQTSSVRTKTKDNDMANLSTVRYGGDTFSYVI